MTIKTLVVYATVTRVMLKRILIKNGFEVVGEVGNSQEALEQYTTLSSDVVTIDVTMPYV